MRQERAHPELSQGPADLQSAALTTELCALLSITVSATSHCVRAHGQYTCTGVRVDVSISIHVDITINTPPQPTSRPTNRPTDRRTDQLPDRPTDKPAESCRRLTPPHTSICACAMQQISTCSAGPRPARTAYCSAGPSGVLQCGHQISTCGHSPSNLPPS